jgi:carotenoid cleavage dioxygenase-like enzyme
MDATRHSFTYAKRNEVTCTLNVIEGELPTDLYGYVFINSPCGSVNSDGLPYPKYEADGETIHAEYGTNILNGDAMLFRFDLNQKGRIDLKTAILKTPCYYADEATKQGSEYHSSELQFESRGIARISERFGARNQLNTALTPFKLKDDQHSRLTANFDSGRPWEVDAEHLCLQKPFGGYKDWVSQFPKAIPAPFQSVQTTAHPAFDPLTYEFFSVNFTKTFTNMFFYRRFNERLSKHKIDIREQFKHILAKGKHLSREDQLQRVNNFYKYIDFHLLKSGDWWRKVKMASISTVGWITSLFMRVGDRMLSKENGVFLVRWQEDEMHSWKIIDAATDQPIVINQCMHQNSLTEDYLILSDSAFKFAGDVMLNNPFPDDHEIDRILRQLTAYPQAPETPVFLIKRSDLDPNSDTVNARRLVLDLEVVHFSADYKNPNGQITLHTAHNAASCGAEWIRPYDELVVDEGETIFENTIGLVANGQMDIGRIGKYVLDGEQGTILSNEKIYLKGDEKDVASPGAHTWAVGLYTYRDMLSPMKTVDEVQQIYWQSFGADPRFLTHFLKDLYCDYTHRIVPVEEMIEKNKERVPFCLLRQNTETMQIEDHYLFRFNQNLRSLQFVPRDRRGQHTDDIDLATDGYVLCTLINGTADLHEDAYTREIWIFDAQDLKAGPVCRLSHPDMTFAFTIHSTWLEESISQPAASSVNIQEDIQYAINRYAKEHQDFYHSFMEEKVYPHFGESERVRE